MMRILFSLFFLVTGLAFSQNNGNKGGKVSRDLNGLDPNSSVDVVIQYVSPPNEDDDQLIKGNGGQRKLKFSSIKGVSASVPVKALAGLSHNPKIAYISRDRKVPSMLDVTALTVGAVTAWQAGLDGTGIGVAVIDSGMASGSTDFLPPNSTTSRIVYAESFVSGVIDTGDTFGHGTHVAGIVAGSGQKSGSLYKGIAPGANIINLRVLDDTGTGKDSWVIAAIDRAIQLKNQYNIRVINLSVGRPVYESYAIDPLCQAAESAWKAGIVVVAAAGNSGRDNSQGTHGYATIAAPGNDPYVITVGAMKTMGTPSRSDDLIATYSAKGPTLLDHIVKPDIVAPGNLVVSSMFKTLALFGQFPGNEVYRNNTDTGSVYNTYYKLSGTSMATPVVSAAAAILLQKDASLTPDQVKARLMKTASKNFPPFSSTADPATGIAYTSQYDVFTIGAGYLDIGAALASTDVAALPALSPTVAYNQQTGIVSIVFNTSAVWGSSAMWGTSAVWGSSAMWGTSAVWGSSAVWGDSTATGFSAVWGNSAVWGTGITSSSALAIAIYGEP